MIERENDPIAGIINGLGFAFLFWTTAFIVIQIIRAIF